MAQSLTLRQFEREFDAFRSHALSRSEFTDMEPATRDHRVEAARGSRWLFAQTYFPDYVSTAAAPFHSAWEGIAADARRVHVVEAFRGAGKSTFFNFIDIAYRLVFRTSRFAVIASLNEDKSAMYVARILAELLYNRRLSRDFGAFELAEYARGARNFVLVHRDSGETGHVKAVSIGQDPRGLISGPFRPDVARLDDIQTVKRARNPKFVRETVGWILADLVPAMAADFSMAVLATRVNDRDVLADLEKRARDTDLIALHRFPAERGGKSTWPAAFPRKRLRQIKAIVGTAVYNQEMLLIPISIDDLKFKSAWLRYYTDAELPPMRVVISWTDPSSKSGAQHDYKAIVVCGLGTDGRIYVLDAWIKKASVGAMVEAMYDLHERWGPAYMFWEDNGHAILDDVFSMYASGERYGYRLPTRAETNTVTKEVRIEQTLSAPIERGDILFRRSDTMQELLIEQLLQFPDGEHDDGPDALEGAVRKLRSRAGRRHAKPTSTRPLGAHRLLEGYT